MKLSDEKARAREREREGGGKRGGCWAKIWVRFRMYSGEATITDVSMMYDEMSKKINAGFECVRLILS